MRKQNKWFWVLITVVLISTVLVGCSANTNTQSLFGMEQFKSAMTGKGYTFKIEDVQKDFLPTTRQRMMIDDKTIDIYLFDTDKEMENAASHIDSSGFSYKNGSQGVEAGWVSSPHFYKKGTIIVQYVGENEKIMSDLTHIVGEQFAGDIQK